MYVNLTVNHMGALVLATDLEVASASRAVDLAGFGPILENESKT